MSVRAKFLAELKKNAQSSPTSEKKNTASSYTSDTTSTGPNENSRRSKRKRIGDASDGALRDVKATCGFDRKRETKPISTTGGGQTFKMPYVVQKNETYPGLMEYENTTAHHKRVGGFHSSNKDHLQGDGDNLREFGVRIKREPFAEDVGHGSIVGNDDLSFFISLLPHIGNIPQEMKLRFRNRVNEVVDEFAYSNIAKR